MSTPPLTPPTPDDPKRISLLDTIRDSLARQNKTTLLYRIIVCGSIPPQTDRSEIIANYQKLFKTHQTDTDLITGLLVLYPETYIHILESSTKTTYAFMTSLQSHPLLGKSKVLAVLDDVYHRFFPFWAGRVLEGRAGVGGEDVVEVDEDVVAGVCVELCKVGVGLGTMGKNDLKVALDELTTQFRDSIPRSSLLSAIIQSKTVMSIEEWIDIYAKSFTLVLESERVWPAQRPLVF
ncbi:uncharacterized protein SPPG_01953 [Spizellomyces punctatus DAOM BR117]|uniref:BLUF domain-containing protein n=1 Tax=Spizellomyces punctatus (strain DAOM BR117) TaxID=645134 RepID=A0A0L0HP88_SPIPD|nr:uncharacterized protein SPPG_01953 [Spizellomyces punctatus DAOM BR117]KND02873.1 hypothetical protein SPPG_01953 [Spizellomyces punctatus DAOM BR117]|eukprot:XP_016610912.1 hypothetical protein SPPG_01953 [Spizellomyces punctatus DAOM BR117]